MAGLDDRGRVDLIAGVLAVYVQTGVGRAEEGLGEGLGGVARDGLLVAEARVLERARVVADQLPGEAHVRVGDPRSVADRSDGGDVIRCRVALWLSLIGAHDRLARAGHVLGAVDRGHRAVVQHVANGEGLRDGGRVVDCDGADDLVVVEGLGLVGHHRPGRAAGDTAHNAAVAVVVHRLGERPRYRVVVAAGGRLADLERGQCAANRYRLAVRLAGLGDRRLVGVGVGVDAVGVVGRVGRAGEVVGIRKGLVPAGRTEQAFHAVIDVDFSVAVGIRRVAEGVVGVGAGAAHVRRVACDRGGVGPVGGQSVAQVNAVGAGGAGAGGQAVSRADHRGRDAAHRVGDAEVDFERRRVVDRDLAADGEVRVDHRLIDVHHVVRGKLIAREPAVVVDVHRLDNAPREGARIGGVGGLGGRQFIVVAELDVADLLIRARCNEAVVGQRFRRIHIGVGILCLHNDSIDAQGSQPIELDAIAVEDRH